MFPEGVLAEVLWECVLLWELQQVLCAVFMDKISSVKHNASKLL